MEPLSRSLDALGVLSLCAILAVWRTDYSLRGVTYRKSVIPLWQDKLFKALFYFGALTVMDMGLRRGIGLIYRIALVHAPFSLWALTGPLSASGTTRDDRGWSDSFTRSRVWFWIVKYIFGHGRVLLSEEWLDLTAEQRMRWHDKHYVVPSHPHGLLPIGAIVNGATWAAGGLRGVTTSGAELPEPENPGTQLHQRWFRNLRLRAAVASGAIGLFPGFYEMFHKLGFFECTKPFMQKMLRDGRDVAVFPGGAQESCYATPGRYVCYVKNRKGFVRLALEERRDLLPLWCFGDEGLVPIARYEDLPRFFRALQHFCKDIFGLVLPPAITGLPRFVPTTLVTGVPVSLEDLWPEQVGGEVSDAAVDEAHKRYMQAVRCLFDKNKALVPGGHEHAVLEIL